MTTKTEIKIEASWDKNVVPADRPKRRGLLIDVFSITEKVRDRRPINLSMVIDRSGSMANGRLAAAKEAAKGVVERLGSQDIFSLVVFDSNVETLVSGTHLNADGKHEVIGIIGAIHTRGMTDLAGGWLDGAACAARVIDTMDFKSGHVILLSDGHANVGITNPLTIRSHADEMASRGITTSAIGVGNGYSPSQLEALSEGGMGRLHDAGTPEEMIETILGELGEVVSVVAANVELYFRWPRELRSELLADYGATRSGNSMVIRLGQLTDGARRTLPFMVDVPASPVGEVMTFGIEVSAKHPESGEDINCVTTTTEIVVLPPAESRAVERDNHIAERIVRLWENTLGLDAMRLNEQGDFAGATGLVRDVGDRLASYSIGTAAEGSIRQNLHSVAKKVMRPWAGRSKRESMIAAKKFSKGERDHRSDSKGDWSDHL